MQSAIPFGKKQVIEGRLRVYYYGYWVKAYDVPADTLLAKKRLIEALTRRLFNHVEHGLNVPGVRLDEARRGYEAESDPQRKRVMGAMLAGCLFNRAADIFTKLVEIQAMGVTIAPDNALMRECGDHLQEALTLGQLVLHRSGEEGLDELWGEPFKAFAFPIEDFYNSRYIKIAQSMQAIDGIGRELVGAFADEPAFEGAAALVDSFVTAAKVKCETLRTDDDIFDVWTSFVVSAERLAGFEPVLPGDATPLQRQHAAEVLQLIASAKDVVSHITRARVPMPKTSRALIERCQRCHLLACAPSSLAERARSRESAA
jgi:hypothetical protein